MSFPLVPNVTSTDWIRRAASAINHLLGRLAELTLVVSGKPDSASRVLRFPLRHTMKLVLDKSKAEAVVASTGSAVFTIKLDAATIGTVTFSASAVGVIALTSTDLTDGAFLQIYAPSPQDATLSDVSITLAIAR